MNDKYLIQKIIGEQIKKIEEIHQGVSNTSYLVNQKWVVRIKNHPETFYSYKNEKEILHLTARAYLSEIVVYLDKDGNKVSEYIPDTKTFSHRNQEIIAVAKMLKKLHDYKVKTNIKFEPFKRFNYYKKNSKSKDRFSHENLIIEKTKKIYQKYPLVICHNDLVDNNLLFSKKRSYLIDYEFAGKNIFLFDLASFISENNIDDKKQQNLFLNTYDKNLANRDEIMVLTMFQNLLWHYWALERYHATKRNIFLNIAKEKKSRILRDIRLLKID